MTELQLVCGKIYRLFPLFILCTFSPSMKFPQFLLLPYFLLFILQFYFFTWNSYSAWSLSWHEVVRWNLTWLFSPILTWCLILFPVFGCLLIICPLPKLTRACSWPDKCGNTAGRPIWPRSETELGNSTDGVSAPQPKSTHLFLDPNCPKAMFIFWSPHLKVLRT